jgi:NADH-quinone oxidoreductase subunit J
MERGLFYFFGVIAVLAATSVVVQRKVIYSAISLIVCLCSLSGIYLLLEAQFIAAVQVIVYAGAIMVLFLFVIMLLDPFCPPILADKKRYLLYLAVFLGFIVMILLFPLLTSYNLAGVPRMPLAWEGETGSTYRIGLMLFNEYLLPFEVTSILILVAIMGAVVLAKKNT